MVDVSLSRRLLILYSLPYTAYMATSIPISIWLLKFSTDVLLLAPAAMGGVLLVARLWDAVSDPMAGYLTDRTHSRYGRRRVWMLAAAVPLAVTLTMAWAPPAALEGALLVAWMAFALILWETASTAFYIPYQALGLELTRDYHERTRLFAWRQIVSVAGYGVALGAVYVMRTGDDPRQAATLAALALGSVLAGTVFLAARRLPEPESHQGRGGARLLDSFRDVLRNPHARILFVVYGVELFGMGVISTLAPYVIDDVIGRGDLLELLLACWVIPQFVLAPMWLRLSRRYGKKRLWISGMIATALGFGGILPLGDGDWPYLFGLVLLIGVGSGIGNVMSPSVQADVVDFDEMQTGERKEGAYSAAWNFIRKASMAAAAGMGGFALSAAGYDGEAEVQSELVRETIRAVAGVVPAVLYGLAVVLFSRFALDEREHARVRAAIDRHSLDPRGD